MTSYVYHQNPNSFETQNKKYTSAVTSDTRGESGICCRLPLSYLSISAGSTLREFRQRSATKEKRIQFRLSEKILSMHLHSEELLLSQLNLVSTDLPKSQPPSNLSTPSTPFGSERSTAENCLRMKFLGILWKLFLFFSHSQYSNSTNIDIISFSSIHFVRTISPHPQVLFLSRYWELFFVFYFVADLQIEVLHQVFEIFTSLLLFLRWEHAWLVKDRCLERIQPTGMKIECVAECLLINSELEKVIPNRYSCSAKDSAIPKK